MDLYTISNGAVETRYPTDELDAQYVAEELAARLDDLVLGSSQPFSNVVSEGIPTTDVEAIYVGLDQDWSIPWWTSGNDFGVKVVSGKLNAI